MAMIDIIILVIIVISSLFGVFRGLIKEALSLAAWFAAIFIAGTFSGMLAELMGNFIDNPTLRRVAAFALLFVVTIALGTIASNMVSKLTSAVGLGGLDKILGAGFGLLRGAVVVLILMFISSSFEFTQPWYEESILAPYALDAIEYLETIFL
jgi:membrane protein required for colicin V production